LAVIEPSPSSSLGHQREQQRRLGDHGGDARDDPRVDPLVEHREEEFLHQRRDAGLPQHRHQLKHVEHRLGIDVEPLPSQRCTPGRAGDAGEPLHGDALPVNAFA
jgi:hypothetical protein